MLRFDTIEGFEWDDGNIDKNRLLHNVSNAEAEQIFFNEPLVAGVDEAHTSDVEHRYRALGRTDADRRFFAVFTLRKASVRIISIRDMSKKERKIYDEEAKRSPQI